MCHDIPRRRPENNNFLTGVMPTELGLMTALAKDVRAQAPRRVYARSAQRAANVGVGPVCVCSALSFSNPPSALFETHATSKRILGK